LNQQTNLEAGDENKNIGLKVFPFFGIPLSRSFATWEKIPFFLIEFYKRLLQ